MKTENNIERDKHINSTLNQLGFGSLIFLEKKIEKDLVYCVDLIEEKVWDAKSKNNNRGY